MTSELTKVYDHRTIEKELYEWWEKEGFFRPEKSKELGIINEKSEKFCITIPLPNVTGQLHSGHALVISLEDLMTRYERMRQKETLYIPGTDHAGIATQSVVVRELLKQGINHKDLGREKFVEKVWEWKHKYHARITEQSKRMGISCDWSREHFTLDPDLSRAVRVAFYILYHKGLIYRGEYMVNWCPGRCVTAISDLETEAIEEQGQLWYIKYPVITKAWRGPQHPWGSGKWAQGATDFIIVATTRPETLLGDSAVATIKSHPKFAKYINKEAVIPAVSRLVPIIVDPFVDPEFGTGALKITPAHDPNDFEIGKKHGLDFINIFNETAQILPGFVEAYAGLDRFECRKEILKDLEKEGLLTNTEPYIHSEPHCQRCHSTIEPRVSVQWFVKTKPLAEPAMEKVRNGETIIIPEREQRRFFQWMENIHDWCISRQLWWGHRIPVWYCDDCDEEICPEPDVETVSTCPKCSSSSVHQDEDVLDTWFSSGLWPFSTLGWPNTEHPDYMRFYPTDTRETGYDILFFWVAKEMMLGIELTGQTPYHTVYLHGMIRDEKGRKISKSMENIDQYDPLVIIKDYGADSLRYVMISNSVPGLDTNYDPKNIEVAHKYCNKIWQASRYVLTNIASDEIVPKIEEIDLSKLKFPDKWILSRLNSLIKDVQSYMDNYDYLRMTREIKSFFWSEFCDWYIEMSKIFLYDENYSDKHVQKAILLHVLETFYKLLHPVMPFITEKLWQSLPDNLKTTPTIMYAPWPTAQESFIDPTIEDSFLLMADLVREVRWVKHDFGIPLKTLVPLQISIETEVHRELFKLCRNELVKMAFIDENKFIIDKNLVPPPHAARIVLRGIPAFVPLSESDIEKHKARIHTSLEKAKNEAVKIEKKLQSQFSERAPKELVEKERKNLEELRIKIEQLEDQLKLL
ncbi:MAG: valine--tRNA ligase [Promethearchaeota archaeon]|nr:MAG: valine--tRNA ligase [Candidatus Lokiarchaeota archaeon]